MNSEWCVQVKGREKAEWKKERGSILGKHYAVNANDPHHMLPKTATNTLNLQITFRARNIMTMLGK